LAILPTRGPHNHHHPAFKKTDRLIPALAVVETRVFNGQGIALKHDFGVFERKAALGKRSVSLGLVEGDLHVIV
jgi:hypothetical protein